MIEDEINNYELAENGICPINCKHCAINKKCLKCRNNYGLINSKENNEIICLPLSQLIQGYYKYNNIYYPCMENCLTCSNDISCTKCIDDYTYANNKCLKKIENCKIYGDDELCDECKEKYSVNENRIECIKKKELFIVQVQIINNHLKIYFILSNNIDGEINIKLSLDLFKYSNNIRNIEESLSEKLEINLNVNDVNRINNENIYEFTSEEEFNENDRILVNPSLEKNNLYELKLLNNNNKILDTEGNKKMIQNKEIFDFSEFNNNYNINKYIISSITKGCNFYLISNRAINEFNQSITLNFYDEDNINNNIDITCILSNENKYKIPCSLQKEIKNKNYSLDSYIGSNNESIFYIIQDNDANFQLNCINETGKEKENKSNKTQIIIIIVIVIVVLIVIGIIIYILYKKRKKENNNDIYSNNNINIDKNSVRNDDENNNNMDISFSDR